MPTQTEKKAEKAIEAIVTESLEEAVEETTEEIPEPIVNEDEKASVADDITPEVQAQIDASLAAAQKAFDNPQTKVRTRKAAASATPTVDIGVPLPADFDLDSLSPASFLVQPVGKITGSIDTQQFVVIEERLEGLIFTKPALPLERGRALRVVKAISPNGVLVQLPFEGQHNNAAAGEPQDALGIRYYQRKGFLILMNMDTLIPIYCFARNCHAAAMRLELSNVYPQHADVTGSGYCSFAHMEFTEPNLARTRSPFEIAATTTQTYQKNR